MTGFEEMCLRLFIVEVEHSYRRAPSHPPSNESLAELAVSKALALVAQIKTTREEIRAKEKETA